MNLALWIAAGLLAVAYLIAGGGKLILPKEKIAATGAASRWVEDFSPGALKAIGTLELLAAMGLILPAALDIAPVLVPLAALGLVMLMVGAVITRIRRHEAKFMVGNLVLLALAGFVAWGRFGPSPSPVDGVRCCGCRTGGVDRWWEATQDPESAIRRWIRVQPRLARISGSGVTADSWPAS